MSRKMPWSELETRTLLEIWGEDNVQLTLRGCLKNRHVFEYISEKMNDSGFIRTTEQCYTRIKRLKYGFVHEKWVIWLIILTMAVIYVYGNQTRQGSSSKYLIIYLFLSFFDINWFLFSLYSGRNSSFSTRWTKSSGKSWNWTHRQTCLSQMNQKILHLKRPSQKVKPKLKK